MYARSFLVSPDTKVVMRVVYELRQIDKEKEASKALEVTGLEA